MDTSDFRGRQAAQNAAGFSRGALPIRGTPSRRRLNCCGIDCRRLLALSAVKVLLATTFLASQLSAVVFLQRPRPDTPRPMPAAFLSPAARRAFHRKAGPVLAMALAMLLLLWNQVAVPIHLLTVHHEGTLLQAAAPEAEADHPCQPGLDAFRVGHDCGDPAFSHEAHPASPRMIVFDGYSRPGATIPQPVPAPSVPPPAEHRHHAVHHVSEHSLLALVALLAIVLARLLSELVSLLPHRDRADRLRGIELFSARSRGPPAAAW